MSERVRRGSGSDEILRACLAQGLTIREAARRASMSERTARRRLQDPEFVAALRVLEGQLASAIAAQLTALSFDALGALPRLVAMDSEPQIQLRAIQLILTMSHRYRETEDGQRRLAALETAAISHGALLEEVAELRRRATNNAR